MSKKTVCIKWIDAETNFGWTDIDEDVKSLKKNLPVCYTLGYLLDKGKDGYIVAQTVGADNQNINGRIFIPRGCVINIDYI